MSKKHTVRMVGDGEELFVIFDGIKIAKRGQPSTTQAGTWIALEPGYEVKSILEKGEPAIEVLINGVVIH